MRVRRVSIFGGSGTGSGDIESVLTGRGLYGGAESGGVTLYSQFDIKEYPFTTLIEAAYVLYTAVVNERIKRVEIAILTPFNDGATTISVGHSGSPGGLMAASENIPTKAGNYTVEPKFLYGGSEDIKLYVSPAGSTEGAGICFIESEMTT